MSTTVSLEPSAFVPLALGFLGLGVGYLIYTVAAVLNMVRGFNRPL